MYEPGTWVARVSPTPLLMIVARHDPITLTDLALGAYEAALQPKKLVTIDGGHFDPYLTGFAEASRAAVVMVHRAPHLEITEHEGNLTCLSCTTKFWSTRDCDATASSGCRTAARSSPRRSPPR